MKTIKYFPPFDYMGGIYFCYPLEKGKHRPICKVLVGKQ